MSNETIYAAAKMLVLSNQTPIEAKASDHNMLINNGILFYNMMMQGRWNNDKKSYNNGFGFEETDADYQKRIALTVKLLAEACTLNPMIFAIGLAEAPVKLADIQLFIKETQNYPSLKKFSSTLTTEAFTSWGIATFIDTQQFTVTQQQSPEKNLPSLKDRIQAFLLQPNDGGQNLYLVNLHLPYDIAKSKDNRVLMNFARQLFQSQHDQPVIVMGDFNIHPHIIANKACNVTAYVQNNNNLILNCDKKGKITGAECETVDGILHSNHLARRMHRTADATQLSWYGLNLRKEYDLMKTAISSKLAFFRKTNKIIRDEFDLQNNMKLLAC